MGVAGSTVDLDSFKDDLVDEILEDDIEVLEEGWGDLEQEKRQRISRCYFENSRLKLKQIIIITTIASNASSPLMSKIPKVPLSCGYMGLVEKKNLKEYILSIKTQPALSS